jgi:surfactin synthase thioesterase subunit
MTGVEQVRQLRLGPSEAGRKVVVLHFAGGSAASLMPLVQPLLGSCAVVSLELNDRAEPSTTFDAAVDRVRSEFEGAIDRPTVVFGHSMGALMAHALMERLPRQNVRHVTDVVLSASRSPATTRKLATFPAGPFTSRSRSNLLVDMTRYGGCPPELFSDPELLEHAVQALAQDMQLIDTYRGQRDAVGAGCDVNYHIWYGEDDEEADMAEAGLWTDDLPCAPSIRGFRGGHFYLLEHPEAAAALRHLTLERNGRA